MAARVTVFVLGTASFLVAFVTAADDFIKFGYKGSIGPDKWGSLSENFRSCSDGKQQSPIDIVKDNAVYNAQLDSLDRDYIPSNATLINNGFNIALKFEDSPGTTLVDGKNYSLLQMHWHSPSEHTLDGVQYPVELHLIHQSDDGNIVVVAILYQYGDDDPFLLQIKDNFVDLAQEVCSGDEEAHIPVGLVDTKSLRRATRKYFRYLGSLTVPPCTENVIWNVLGKVREISKEQAAALIEPLEVEYRNNSRPLQALNGRKVELYDESSSSSR